MKNFRFFILTMAIGVFTLNTYAQDGDESSVDYSSLESIETASAGDQTETFEDTSSDALSYDEISYDESSYESEEQIVQEDFETQDSDLEISEELSEVSDEDLLEADLEPEIVETEVLEEKSVTDADELASADEEKATQELDSETKAEELVQDPVKDKVRDIASEAKSESSSGLDYGLGEQDSDNVTDSNSGRFSQSLTTAPINTLDAVQTVDSVTSDFMKGLSAPAIADNSLAEGINFGQASDDISAVTVGPEYVGSGRFDSYIPSGGFNYQVPSFNSAPRRGTFGF